MTKSRLSLEAPDDERAAWVLDSPELQQARAELSELREKMREFERTYAAASCDPDCNRAILKALRSRRAQLDADLQAAFTKVQVLRLPILKKREQLSVEALRHIRQEIQRANRILQRQAA